MAGTDAASTFDDFITLYRSNPVGFVRDELWLSVRDWLSTRGVKIPNDASLRHELVAPRYTFTSTGSQDNARHIQL